MLFHVLIGLIGCVTPVNEVQAVVCWASQLAMSSNAWLQFQFRHNISRPLYANTSLADLKSALEEMFTIGVVELWANEDYLQGLEGVNSQPNATVCNPTANISKDCFCLLTRCSALR